MLDPRTDYLIMLFPEGFWLDADAADRDARALIEAVVHRRGWRGARSSSGGVDDSSFVPPRGLLVDLDGVVYHGDPGLPGAPAFFRFLRARGIPFLLTTNNSTLGPHQYVEKLAAMDIEVSESEVLGQRRRDGELPRSSRRRPAPACT